MQPRAALSSATLAGSSVSDLHVISTAAPTGTTQVEVEIEGAPSEDELRAREATDLLIKVLQARRNRGDMTQKFRDLLKSVSKMQAMIRRKKIADRSGWLTMPMVSPAQSCAIRARARLHPARCPSLFTPVATHPWGAHTSRYVPRLLPPIISPRTPHLSSVHTNKKKLHAAAQAESRTIFVRRTWKWLASVICFAKSTSSCWRASAK